MVSDTDRQPLAWAPQALSLFAAFAISFAMPVGLLLTLALLGTLTAGISLAVLRRHGGQGVPTLPLVLED